MTDNKIKIGVMSDVHLEFEWEGMTGPDVSGLIDNVDLILLAGDIDKGPDGVYWAASVHHALHVPVVFIAGNHEFYGWKIEKSMRVIRERKDSRDDVHFLENEVWIGEVRGRKIRVLGCTLWTDYDLYGTPGRSKELASYGLNDHRLITEDIGAPDLYTKFTPSHAQRRHFISRMWLQDELNKRFDGTTVVMTHHAPHPKSVESVYMNNNLTPAYCSDLSEMIAESDVALWVHGHMHKSKDYVVEGTRVVCNPRGYFGESSNPSFDPNLILEV